ncbi:MULTISPECIES: hypothetical protein [Pseudoalteromonas]|uniref:Uncharacterized protein n=1 Tax=Pseudoalteromonas arctica A 37-1-2 TaxID=1117313 RepID=A0A290SA36_9GAMM|nr:MULTISPECIES: hypothetical protein [Pseudoalteromonas]ATC88749.1 hypothetical protein PARC_b0566 [Pseudoalteromonas arctica A 37-1-2]MBH0001535.1 hypothetical protein [Pseudoalteromonas sp. SWYJZ12]
MIKFLVSFLVLLPLFAQANTDFCEDHTPRTTATHGGEKYGLVVPGSKVKKAGSWSPKEMVSPPLATYKAYSLVQDWAVSNLPKFDGIEIRSVELVKYHCLVGFSKEEYWYYIVEYDPLLDGNKMYGSKNFVAVLMSGEVIGVESI